MPNKLIKNIRNQLLELDDAGPKNTVIIDKASKELLSLCNVSDESSWQDVHPFLYRIQSVIGVNHKLKFFKLIAELKPLDFTIYILSPYIYEEVNTHHGKGPDKNLIISSITVAMKESCKKEEIKISLIDELEHLVAHYAKNEDHGKSIANSIAKGVTNALLTNSEITFNDVTNIRQAYWNKQKCTNVNPHRVHRTVRINGLPFAEGIFVYLMAHYAHEYGIHLKIESIPWQDVGTALLTNRIDVAIHNDSIKDSQLRGLQRLANHRILYRTENNLFRYKGYYILGRKEIPDNDSGIYRAIDGKMERRVAVVQNSDHELVFKNWWDNGPRAKKNKRLAETVWLPVRTPDAALAAVVDGKADYCLVGGIHKTYALDAFRGIFKTKTKFCRKLPDDLKINICFWSVSSRKSDSSILLNDLTTLWTDVSSRWSSVKYSEDAVEKNLRESCVFYVNGQPNQAFVETFGDDLQKLIDDHNDLYELEVGKIISQEVEGW